MVVSAQPFQPQHLAEKSHSSTSHPLANTIPRSIVSGDARIVSLIKRAELQPKRRGLTIRGSVDTLMDRDIGRSVYRLQGALISNHSLRVPKQGALALQETHRYAYIQLRPLLPEEKCFAVHLELEAKDGLSVRLSISSMFRACRVLPTSVQLPLTVPKDELAKGHWMVIALDFEDIMARFARRRFKSLKSVEVCANMLFRDIFLTDLAVERDEMPRDLALKPFREGSWDDHYDWMAITTCSSDLQPISVDNVPYSSSTIFDEYALRKCRSFKSSKSVVPIAEVQQQQHQRPRTPIHRNGAETKAILIAPDSEQSLQLKTLLGHTTLAPRQVLRCGPFVIFSHQCTIVMMNVETQEQQHLHGHTATVTALTLRPDGEVFASAQDGANAIIRFWDMNGQCIHLLKVSWSRILGLSFSMDGEWFLGLGGEQHKRTNICIWKSTVPPAPFATERFVKTAVDQETRLALFTAFERQRFLTAGLQSVRLWLLKASDVRSIALQLPNATPDISSVTFLEVGNQRLLFLSSMTGHIYQIDYDSYNCLKVFQPHASAILSFMIQAPYVMTGHADGQLIQWETHEFFQKRNKWTLSSAIEALVFEQSETLIQESRPPVIVSRDGSLFSLEKEQLKMLSTQCRSAIIHAAFSSVSPQLTLVHENGNLLVWQPFTNQLLQNVIHEENEKGKAIRVLYHPNQLVIAIAHDDGMISFRNSETFQILGSLHDHRDVVVDMIFVTEDRLLTSGNDGNLFLYHFKCNDEVSLQLLNRINGDWQGPFEHLCIDPTGERVFYIHRALPQLLHCMALPSFKRLARIETPSQVDQLLALQYTSLEGKQELIWVDRQSHVYLVDTRLYQMQRSLPCDAPSELWVAAVIQGRWLITLTSEGFLMTRILGRRHYSVPHIYIGLLGAQQSIWIDSQNKLLATCNEQGQVALWQFLDHFNEPAWHPFVPLLDEAVLEKYEEKENVSLEVEQETKETISLSSLPWIHYKPRHQTNVLASKRFAPPPNQAGLLMNRIFGYSGHARQNCYWLTETGRILYSCGQNIILEDTATRDQVILSHHLSDVTCLALQSGQRYLASASGPTNLSVTCSICIWSVDDAVCERVLQGHASHVTAMAFSPDDRLLCTVSDCQENVLLLWQYRQGQILFSVSLNAPVHALAWDLSATQLVTVGQGQVQFWRIDDLSSGVRALPFETELPRDLDVTHFTSVCYKDALSTLLFAGTDTGLVTAWDTRERSCILSWAAENNEITALLSLSQHRLLTGSEKGRLRLWQLRGVLNDAVPDNVEQGSVEWIKELQLDGAIVYLSLSESGTPLGLAATGQGSIWFIQLENNVATRLVSSHVGFVRDVQVTMDYVASVGDDGALRLWRTDTWEQHLLYETNEKALCLTLNPNVALLAVGYQTGAIRTFDLTALQLLSQTQRAHVASVSAICFSDTFLFTGDMQGQVVVSQSRTGLVLRRISEHSGSPISMISVLYDSTAPLADVTRCLISSGNERASLWQYHWTRDDCLLVDWITLPRSIEQEEQPTLALFCEREFILLSGPFKDRSLLVYDTLSKKVVRRFNVPRHAACMDFVNDFIATGTRDHLIQYVDYVSGAYQEFLCHSDKVTKVRFSSDGKWLYSSSFGEVVRWRVTSQLD